MSIARKTLALVALATSLACACIAPAQARWVPRPTGTEILSFEKLEGLILVRAKLSGEAGRDTSGTLLLDTGAGFLALDPRVIRHLGLVNEPRSLDNTNQTLRRLALGSLQIDLVTPVMTVDLEPIRGVTDRPILGLLGERVFHGRALAIDYQDESIAIIPAPVDRSNRANSDHAPDESELRNGSESERTSRAGGSITETAADLGQADRVAQSREQFREVALDHATPIAFRLAGDGKILLRVRVSDPAPPRFGPWRTLILDTGATKSVLFEDMIEGTSNAPNTWKSLRGLSAQNLLGATEARLSRVPAIEIEAQNGVLRDTNVVFGVMRSNLARMLERAVGEPVHGVLGYSLLQRYRVLIDYPRRVLWLDPVEEEWNDRPLEYTHVGIQLERSEGRLRVRALAQGSPAEEAGIETGDELLAVDESELRDLDLVAVTRLLEGVEGTTVRVKLRRGAVVHIYELERRQLL